MKWFANIRIIYKLSILIVLAVISLFVVGYTGYYYVLKSNQNLTAMYKNNLLPVQFLNNSEAQSRHFQVDMLELLLAQDDKRIKEVKDDLDKRRAAFANDLEEYEKADLDPFEIETLRKLREELKNYSESRDTVINLSLKRDKKAGEIYVLYAQTVVPRMDAFQNYTQELADYSVKKAKEKNDQNQVDFEKSKMLMLGIMMTAILLFILCSWMIGRMITKPLQTMILACEELATGDFRDRPRRFVTKDEIGQLGDALVNMRGSLRTVLKQVNESAEQVAASSEELTASSEQSSQAITQVAGSINDVAQGAEKQLKAVNETSAVVEQMSTKIQQAAASSNEVSSQSERAADKVKEGNSSVEEAVSQMAHIEQTVSNSAQVVAKLGERSKEIGQIVDTISGIAGQTNLLALNAAIEAARAGEQGRGFAVVAEEVRKLAEQSQDAAKQIATLISEIQGDTDKAVVAMNEGTREVKVGTEVVTTAGKAFEEIAALVADVSGQVKEISSVMQQMASGSQKIVISVKEIDEQSKKTVGEAQTVSAATEEQSASMEEIASSSQSLAKLAQNLHTAVSHFRV
ncbi:MAG: methyl-accepting chemotaxis protein [Pelosinus sp.]|nr:methyl-accepting chemotaxis protein [Pelosinus sp.]